MPKSKKIRRGYGGIKEFHQDHDVWMIILSFLSVGKQVRISRTCKNFRRITTSKVKKIIGEFDKLIESIDQKNDQLPRWTSDRGYGEWLMRKRFQSKFENLIKKFPYNHKILAQDYECFFWNTRDDPNGLKRKITTKIYLIKNWCGIEEFYIMRYWNVEYSWGGYGDFSYTVICNKKSSIIKFCDPKLFEKIKDAMSQDMNKVKFLS